MVETVSGRAPSGPDWSAKPEPQGVSALTGDHSSHGPTEAERMQAAFDRITHRRIMAAARGLSARQHRRSPNWAFAMSLFGLGSTYAWALCEQMGIDPDATTLTPWPDPPAPAMEAEGRDAQQLGAKPDSAIGNAETPHPEASTSRVGEE